MKAVQNAKPAALQALRHVDLPDPGPPGPGEILVRIRATSLNFHDYLVVTGAIPTREGLIPMSDGAGEIVTVGEGVTDFKNGDLVVSTFFHGGSMATLLMMVLKGCRATAPMVMRASWS